LYSAVKQQIFRASDRIAASLLISIQQRRAALPLRSAAFAAITLLRLNTADWGRSEAMLSSICLPRCAAAHQRRQRPCASR
jgi:hypothetical protein